MTGGATYESCLNPGFCCLRLHLTLIFLTVLPGLNWYSENLNVWWILEFFVLTIKFLQHSLRPAANNVHEICLNCKGKERYCLGAGTAFRLFLTMLFIWNLTRANKLLYHLVMTTQIYLIDLYNPRHVLCLFFQSNKLYISSHFSGKGLCNLS